MPKRAAIKFHNFGGLQPSLTIYLIPAQIETAKYNNVIPPSTASPGLFQSILPVPSDIHNGDDDDGDNDDGDMSATGICCSNESKVGVMVVVVVVVVATSVDINVDNDIGSS